MPRQAKVPSPLGSETSAGSEDVTALREDLEKVIEANRGLQAGLQECAWRRQAADDLIDRINEYLEGTRVGAIRGAIDTYIALVRPKSKPTPKVQPDDTPEEAS